MSEQTKTEKKETTPVVVKTSDVITMLNEGKTRKEIGKHFGLNRANVMRLFQDPSLKGLKTKTGTTFTLVHDVETPNDKKAKKESDTSAADSTTESKAPASAEIAGQENW